MINKIIKKINYEFAEQFEVSAIKNLGFVPINTSPNGVYVAMTTTSNKEKITDYVTKLNGEKVNFTFKREGTKSSRFNAVIIDEKGEELGRVNGIKIYMTTDTLNIDVPLKKNVTNVNAVLKLEDVKSKEEIFRQTIRL